MTKEQMQQFEQDVADAFLAKKIRAPIHLSDGNEEQLIEIFKKVKRTDWVFSTWRSHYHALLHGIDPKLLMDKILAGESITIMVPEHKFFASAIVGGICPISTGVAMGIKRAGGTDHVWCFVGDMTATTGAFHEAVTYATNHDLPITYVIDDNTQSVGTPTAVVWGKEEKLPGISMPQQIKPKVIAFRSHGKFPHVGVGTQIIF